MTYLLFLLFIYRNPTNYSCNINNRSSIWKAVRGFLCLELIEKNVDPSIGIVSTTKKALFNSLEYLLHFLKQKPQDVFSKNNPKWIKYFVEIPHADLYTKLFLMHSEISKKYLFIHRLPSTPTLSPKNLYRKVTSTLFIQTKSIRTQTWMHEIVLLHCIFGFLLKASIVLPIAFKECHASSNCFTLLEFDCFVDRLRWRLKREIWCGILCM